MSALPLPKSRDEEKPAGFSLASSMQGMLDGLKNLPQILSNSIADFKKIDWSKLAEQIKEALGGLGSVLSGVKSGGASPSDIIREHKIVDGAPSRPATTILAAAQDDHLKPTEVAAAQPDNKTSAFALNALSMTTPEVTATQPAPANKLNLQAALG